MQCHVMSGSSLDEQFDRKLCSDHRAQSQKLLLKNQVNKLSEKQRKSCKVEEELRLTKKDHSGFFCTSSLLQCHFGLQVLQLEETQRCR